MKHALAPSVAALLLVAGSAYSDNHDRLEAIVAPGVEVKKLGGGMKFTEGPVWIPSEKKVVFSDIPNSVLMQWSEAGGLEEFREVEQSNGNILDLEGNILSCQHGGRNVIRIGKDGEVTVLAETYQGKKFNSPNDLAIRSGGAIRFTDPSYGLRGRPAGVEGKWVYKLDPKSGDVTVVYKGFDMPNGIAFSPDEERVYIADSGKVAKIRAFEVVEKDMLGEPVWEIDQGCDGLCVDTEGNLYTTSGGGIHVYDKNGKKLGLIKTPENPANVCFGGADYDTLYITARTGLYSVVTKMKGAKPKAAKW